MNPSGSIKNNYFLIVFDISLTRYVYSHNHLKTIFGVTTVLPNYELSKTMADGRVRADFWKGFSQSLIRAKHYDNISNYSTRVTP